MKKVLVIGGGAAGMMAAVFAARGGREVHVFEKNEKLGKKLFITGKGRCNITNAGEMDTLFTSVVSNSKFLYSAFYGFTNEQTITFFEELGVPVKIERGNRVFPVSDHSSDVIGALSREMNRLGVEVHLHAEVEKILTDREYAIWTYAVGKSGTDKRNPAEERKRSRRRRLHRCNRRDFLSVHRIHWGWPAVCGGTGTESDGTFSRSCADGSERVVCKRTAGTLSAKCDCGDLRWKEKTV